VLSPYKGVYRGTRWKTGRGPPSTDEIIRQLTLLDALQLGRVIAAAEEQRATKLQEAKDALIARVREEASALGFDPADLFAKPTPAPLSGRKGAKSGMKKGQSPAPDKYRSPNGKNVWSGRGKTPAWLLELEAAGHNQEEFRILDAQSDLIEQASKGRSEAA